MVYTYVLVNSLDNKPFYVGKGSGNRMYIHEKYATGIKKFPKNKSSLNMHPINKIKNLLKNEGKVIYEKRYEGEDEDRAYLTEDILVEYYGLENLTNIIPGGRGGMKGYKQSPEHAKNSIKNLDEARKKQKGRKLFITPQRKEQLRKQQKEILTSSDVRAKAAATQRGQKRPKISAALKGKKKSAEHRKNLSIATTERMKDKNLKEQISRKVSQSLIGNQRRVIRVKIQFSDGTIQIFSSQKKAADFLKINEVLLSDIKRFPDKKRRKKIDFIVIC